MMINDMMKKELNVQEMNGVAGGYSGSDVFRDKQESMLYNKEGNPFYTSGGEVGSAWESVGTAWEVVKYAFEVCG